MQADNPFPDSPREPACAGNAYDDNPYLTGYEQYGLEFLDRNNRRDDDIEQVVILGDN